MLKIKSVVFRSRWLAALALLLGTHISAGADGPEWLGSEWNHRVSFTAKPDRIAGASAHEDFTLLLQIEATNLPQVFQEALPDGSDLVITLGNGLTILDHEVVSFDPVAQSAEIWFRAPELSDTDNEFYLYYGAESGAPLPTPGAAWGSEHLAVYHFDEDPTQGVLADHGPGANDAETGFGSSWPSGLVPGVIGDGWQFDGLTDWVHTESISSPDSSFTVSAWFANSDLEDEGMVAMQSIEGFWDLAFRRTQGSPNAGLRTGNGTLSWLPALLDAVAHHYVWTLDASTDTARFFLDGIERNVLGRFPPPPAESEIYTGERLDGRIGICGPVFFNNLDLTQGIVDEYRLAEGARDPDWILTEFRNQEDPVGFYDYGQPESQLVAVGDPPARGPGVITAWPNPFQGVAGLNIDLDGDASTVRVYDVAGRLVRSFEPPVASASGLRLRWDGRDDGGVSVGSGIYYIRAVGSQGEVGAKVLLVR